MPPENIAAAIVGSVLSLIVGGVLVMWRRRHRHEDRTSTHGERLAALEVSVTSLEKATERGFDRIADKIDGLPCKYGYPCTKRRSA